MPPDLRTLSNGGNRVGDEFRSKVRAFEPGILFEGFALI